MHRPSVGRAIAIILGLIGIAASIGLFATLWLSPEDSRLRQAQELVDVGLLIVQFAIALIIAWRGGAQAANVALALALLFIFGTDTWGLWQLNVWPDSWLLDAGRAVLFYLGAAFYIRSAQTFPRPIERANIVASATVWGRFRVLRASVIFLLRPWAVWVVAAILTSLSVVFDSASFADLVRMIIVLLGIVYFYITFRSGDPQARSKVMWFLEAAVVPVAALVIVLALRAVLGDSPLPVLRASLSLIVSALSGLALTACFLAAVFYAGAIDPALVVRKTFIVAATASLLLFLFAACEHYLVHLLVHALGATNGIVTAVLAALFGYAFHPLKHRLEHFLQRVLPGERRSGH